ncbi:unnamed protein product [Mucor circinelloides]|uniref:Uncharacterized protein n=1 Tax=Mucor circinelloides f. circinelloides (strain 1006PhL) TaxID=1220926 RepID=S2JI54_MUCC1|nr:hypothetical protein HMPREF1544_11076 [Mucor circinelloides 1006PhL]KAG1109904.1 hypothetical protein G6F42_015503 [Rhizopus arrhizus]
MAPKKFNNKNKEPKTPVTNDPRFSSVHNDPRFLRPKKKDVKVTIDKRFAGMMDSKDFSDGPRVDKYGRRLEQGNAKKELERFYQLEESDDDDEDEDEDKSLEQLVKELAEDPDNLADEISEHEPSDEEAEASGKTGYDLMRGRGEISSSDEDSSDDDAESDVESEVDEIDRIKHIQEGEETSRLALVNMDWDKIKAVDILKVLGGFKPDTGIIKSVTIYPSEFGKERLALEETQGPPQEIFKSNKKKDESDDDSDDSDEEITAETIIKNQLEEGDGQDFDQEALRKYQLDRLKYYYAVIECDNPQTAKVIYKTCDNTEYESSANFFDLRYIPEDMTFEDEPKDTATVAPEGYQPTKFKTDALQRTKVSLTWDEDDVDRFQLTRRDFTQDDIKDLDFDIYLASSDEDEDEEEDVDALREKYKKLLGSASKQSAYEDKVDEDEDDGDMEITFTPGLSEAAGALVSKKNEDEHKEETSIETYMRKQKEKRQAKKAAKHKEEKSDQEDGDSDMDAETKNDPFFKEAMEEMADEGFVAKKKESKNAKKKRASKQEREEKARERAELELLMDDDGKSEGFNMKEVLKREKLEKKKKGKKSKKNADLGEDDFEINVSDPRFSAVQESHHFAIDPTNPQFKKTKSMQKLMNARQTKMKETTETVNDEWKKEKKSKSDSTSGSAQDKASKSSLQSLVASVKRKANLDKSSSGKRQKK